MPYSQKAYFICQKYEYEEILRKLDTQLNETLANDHENRERISEIVESMEQVSHNLKRIEELIAREEERTSPEDDLIDDSEEDDLPVNQPTTIQINPLNLFFGGDSSSTSLMQGINNLLTAQQDQTSDQERQRRLNILRQRLAHSFIQTILTGVPINLDNSDDYESLLELENVSIPIKEECLAEIPVETYSEIDQCHKGDKNLQCAVCILDFEADDKCRHLPCDHLFHQDCIEKWFQEKAKCPVCKIDVNEVILKNKIADQLSNKSVK